MNLFGNSTLPGHHSYSPQESALAWANASKGGGGGMRNLLSLFSMMSENAMPADRAGGEAVADTATNAAATDVAMNGPGGRNPTPPPAEGVWKPNPVAQAAAPYTGGLSLMMPGGMTREAPTDFQANARWDGSVPTGPAWLQPSAAPNYKVKNADALMENLIGAKDRSEFTKYVSANADFLKFPRVNRMVGEADRMLQRSEMAQHRTEMEQIASRGRDIQLSAAQGVTTLNKTFADDWNTVIANGTDEERAQVVAFSDPEAFPPIVLQGGITMPNAQARAELAKLKAAQAARIAAANKLVVTSVTDGQPKYGVPRPEQDNTEVTPKEMTLTDGSRAVFNPKTGSFRLMKDENEIKTPTPTQQFQMGTKLIEMDDEGFRQEGTNLIRAAIKGGYKADSVKSISAPNDAAINYLKANPNLRSQFDAKYGAGAAARVLGK